MFIWFTIVTMVVCVIGLTYSDNSNCGGLHFLSKIYYILQYFAMAIGIAYAIHTVLKNYRKPIKDESLNQIKIQYTHI